MTTRTDAEQEQYRLVLLRESMRAMGIVMSASGRREPLAVNSDEPSFWMHAADAAALTGLTVAQLGDLPMQERRIKNDAGHLVTYLLSTDVMRHCKVSNLKLKVACLEIENNRRKRAKAAVDRELQRLNRVLSRSTDGDVCLLAMMCRMQLEPKKSQRKK